MGGQGASSVFLLAFVASSALVGTGECLQAHQARENYHAWSGLVSVEMDLAGENGVILAGKW